MVPKLRSLAETRLLLRQTKPCGMAKVMGMGVGVGMGVGMGTGMGTGRHMGMGIVDVSSSLVTPISP